jgi:3-phosphoshikimate 1-carboxyvinyltransferase
VTTLVVHPATAPLAGSVPVPSDARIGHLALVLGALGSGDTRIAGIARGQEATWTAACLRALGVEVGEPGPSAIVIRGVGLGGLRQSPGALDCGPSGATLRLLASVLVAQPFRSTLAGEASLARASGRAFWRDSERACVSGVVAALRSRGARIEGSVDGEDVIAPPLVVGPSSEGRCLSGIEYESPTPSSEIKTALLLSGLYADGTTRFHEPTVSADHVERMLGALGAPIRTVGPLVQLDPEGWNDELAAFAMTIPGDLSAAAFLLAAAQLVPGSRVVARGVGINPTRAGWMTIARDMGAGIEVEPHGEQTGEPLAEIHAWSAPLRGVAFGGETLARAADDLPLACALGARAAGTTRLVDAGEHLVLVASIVQMLRAFGVACEPRPDGLDIEGGDEPLAPADVDARGDPWLAMTCAVLALVARGPCRVRGAGGIGARYPKFVATLRALGARVDVVPE